MNITVKINEEKNGVELHFPAMPSPEILDRLRADRAWRYHRVGKYWYARRTPATLAFAEALEAGEAIPLSADSPQAEKPAKSQRKPSYEMKYLFSGYRDANGTYYKGSWRLCDGFADGKRAYQIEFSGDTYGNLPLPAGAEFINNSDSMTDYFERSSWFISPDCPDFLGVLEAWEKQEEHDRKRFEKLDARRGVKNDRESRIAYKQRLGLNRADAAASVDREDEDKRRKEAERFAYVAEARRLAELFVSARAESNGHALENAKAQMLKSISAYQDSKREERLDSQRKTALRMVETARQRGNCIELDGIAFVMDSSSFTELFSGRCGMEYTLNAVDTISGDRIYSGTFDSAEARKRKIIDILRDKTMDSEARRDLVSIGTEAVNV